MQDLDRWHARWASGEIGWHRDEPHAFLTANASPRWKRVLVPLCGASSDLGWLADAGYETVGVEISMVAASRVFEARDVVPERDELDGFTRLQAANLTVLVGDYFALDPSHAGVFDAVWDRAALVAVPPELRTPYVETLRRVGPDAELLLVVLDYAPGVMEGPPHAVAPEEVERLFPGAELLGEDDLSEEFAQRGRVGVFHRRLYRAG